MAEEVVVVVVVVAEDAERSRGRAKKEQHPNPGIEAGFKVDVGSLLELSLTSPLEIPTARPFEIKNICCRVRYIGGGSR